VLNKIMKMGQLSFLAVLLFVFFDNGVFSKIVGTEVEVEDVETTEIRMPGVSVEHNETYLCTSYPLNMLETNYIVGFDPIADMHEVHHILLFGCEEPGSEDPVWDCGEMSIARTQYRRAPTCATQPQILYAWGKGAPKLELPKGVGFPVGGETQSRFVVLQVHYMHKTDKEDTSGVRVVSTPIPQPRTASTLLIVTGGTIKPKTTEDFEAACVIDEPVEMHPFAFRVHTHSHGTEVSGWLVREDPTTGRDDWSLIGSRDPQLPQMFEAVKNASVVITPGDIVAARCTIKNNEDRQITIGPTGKDEMCNFYLMYFVEGDRILRDNTCFSPGAPEYHWSSEAGLNHVPHH
jgi:peptidylglycine monooxygenase